MWTQDERSHSGCAPYEAGARRVARRSRAPTGLAAGCAALTAAILISACCATPCPHPPCGDIEQDGGTHDSGGACAIGTLLSSGVGRCTSAQITCALGADVTHAIKDPRFLPKAEFTSDYEARTAGWLKLLDGLAEMPISDPLRVEVADVKGKVQVIQGDEATRRAFVEGGDLAKAVKAFENAGGGPCGAR